MSGKLILPFPPPTERARLLLDDSEYLSLLEWNRLRAEGGPVSLADYSPAAVVERLCWLIGYSSRLRSAAEDIIDQLHQTRRELRRKSADLEEARRELKARKERS